MKNIYIILFLLVACLLPIGFANAQNDTDRVIFEAMQDELQRNKENLKLAHFGKPFFIAYSMATSQRFDISGSLGSIKNSVQVPANAIASVQIMLGDYHQTSDPRYSGQFMKTSMPIDADYNVIRRNLWLASDAVYKSELKNMSAKMAYLKANPKSPEEQAMDDFAKINATTTTIIESPEYIFNQEVWEKNIRELSAVFKEYKEIFNSSVSVSGMNMTVYKKTSEGMTLRQPIQYIHLSASGMVRNKEGETFADSYACLVAVPQKMLSMEELKKNITKFADNLMHLRTAAPIDEFYSGPVLFENGASSQIFTENLLNVSALFAYRLPEGKKAGKTLEDRFGKKVIDNRITVKNYSSLPKYENTTLLGAYSVDAEGVVPEKEMILIENGILKKQLNGRYPSRKVAESTGSSRFLLTSSDIVYVTAPGTIHISVTEGTKQEKMKKALMKAAKEEGLEFAYIIRKIAGSMSSVFRVDVKDGQETMVRIGNLSRIDLPKLKRVLAISASEKVGNYLLNNQVLSSLIYPTSILIEDIEINKPELKKEKTPALTFPLQREG